VFTPASSSAMAAIPDEERPVAASLVTEARQLGAVMGASVAGVAAVRLLPKAARRPV